MGGALRVGAVLSLRDELSGKLRTAGSSVRRFADEAHQGVAKLDRFAGGIARSGAGIVKWFGDGATKLVKNFFTSLKISAAIGTAAASAFFIKTVNDSMKFETTLRNTTALVRGAGKSSGEADAMFKQFGDGILKMAPELARKPQDIADAMYEVVSAGFDGGDALKVIESAARGASAGFTTTDVVVKGLVATLNAYGYGADQAKRVTDVMFQAVNVGSLSFEDFSQNIGDVVGLAATAKVSIEEVGGAIAEMTKRGVVPAEAFTSLNRFLLSIVAPSPQVKTAAETLFGKDSDWSARGLAANGLTGEVKMLLDVLKPAAEDMELLKSSSADVADAATARIAGDKIDVLTQLFGDVRGLRGALILAAADGYTFSDAMNDMQGSVGSVDKAFDEQEKTAGRAKDRISAYFDVIRLQLASGLLPGLADTFKGIGTWIETNIINNPDYANAEGMDKVKVLGKILWTAVTGWWEDHKDEVSGKVDAFFEFIGDKAVPKALEWGVAIGKQIVPAIWKGMTGSSEGSILLALFAGSQALKIPGMTTTAGGGAGGAAGAAGGASMLGKIGAITLSAAVVYLSFNALKNAIDKWGDETKSNEKDFKKIVADATLPELMKGLDAAQSSPLRQNISEGISAGVWGTQTTNEILDAEIKKRAATVYKGLDMITASAGGRDNSGVQDIIDKVVHDERAKKHSTLERNELNELVGKSGSELLAMKGTGTAYQDKIIERAINKSITTAAPWVAEFQASSEEFLAGEKKHQEELAFAGDETAKKWLEAHKESNQMAVDFVRIMNGLAPLTAAFNTGDKPANWRPTEGGSPVPPSTSGAVSPTGAATVKGLHESDPAAGKHGYGQAGQHAIGQALGGRGTVSKPTLFLAGEMGTEDYNFAPHRSGPGMGSARSITVQGPLMHVDTIDSSTDVDELMSELVDALEAVENNT